MEREFEEEHAVPALAELIDVSTLQQIQDWASRTAGVPILIRDADGFPVTIPSMSSDFCDLISGEGHTGEECRRSNVEATSAAIEAGRPIRYTCHAGLTQFSAPLLVAGQLVGTITVGDRPFTPLKSEDVKKLADRLGIDREKLLEASQKVKIWSDDTMNSTINFLYSLASTLLTLCYQGYSLNRKVRELTALLDISKLLTSALGLQEVLDRISSGIVHTLGIKACSIRLLDDAGVELLPKSLYNLSEEYLNKGPVILNEHPVCQAAMRGEVVVIPDISIDSRFSYRKEAIKEGLRSVLCVGLMGRDGAIGAMHLYTRELHLFTDSEIALVQSIANHATAAIENAKLYEESIEKQRIEQELALAAEIQAGLLPKANPDLSGIDVKAKIVPCRQLSGDLYDFVNLGDQRTGVIIADVSGKGAPGAILMATTHAMIRTQSEDTLSAVEVIRKINRSLCADTRSSEFVSMFYGVLDEAASTLTFTNAGHNPPILFRGDQSIFLEEGGIPLGIIENITYSEGQIQFASGDVILLYTDGVTEAMNSEKEIFGVKQLMQVVQQNIALDAQGLIDAIYGAVLNFAAGAPQSDDLTLIVLKVS